MALPGIVSSIDEVPETVREHYVQEGDKWVLDAQGFAPKTKVNEFRERNIALMEENQKLKSSLDGVDVEEYKAFKTQAQRAKEKKLADAGKEDELFSERVAPLKAEKERIEKELSAKLESRDKRLAQLLIDNEIREHAARLGARTTAIDDLILRGHQVFRYQDEKVAAASGTLGKSGDPLTIAEWMGTLSESAPHLFEPSQGGGATKVGAGGQKTPVRTIARSDSKAFLANMDAIAKGDIKVV